MIYVCMRVCIGRDLLMRTYIFQVRACTLYISDIYRVYGYLVFFLHGTKIGLRDLENGDYPMSNV